MSQATLLAAAGIAFAAAALYGYVGRLLGQRRVSERAQPAMQGFATWWGLLGVSTAVTATQYVLGAYGYTDLSVFTTLAYVNILVVVIALYGLLYYLLYLFTGRPGLKHPLGAFYAVYYVLLVYFVTAQNPVALEIRRWSTTLTYEHAITGAFFTVIVLLLLVPQIVGAIALLTLLPKTKDRTARYRILLVSLSIIVWFGTVGLAASTALSASDSWQLASRFLGLGAAVATLLAYRPPGVIRRRLGVASVADEADLQVQA